MNDGLGRMWNAAVNSKKLSSIIRRVTRQSKTAAKTPNVVVKI